MSKRKTYWEKLQDPRWQKKRLEVLESFNWECYGCKTKGDKLNVHHFWYETGKDPWDYENECYVAVCDKCHEVSHEAMVRLSKTLSSMNPWRLKLLATQVEGWSRATEQPAEEIWVFLMLVMENEDVFHSALSQLITKFAFPGEGTKAIIQRFQDFREAASEGVSLINDWPEALIESDRAKGKNKPSTD